MPEINPHHEPRAHQRHGSNIGQPLTRRDGMLKVTGRRTYAADNHPAGMLTRCGGQHALRAAASPLSTSRPPRRIPASSR